MNDVSEEKSRGGSWMVLILGTVLPAAVALALAMALAAMTGCKKCAAERWIGIDRAAARCIIDAYNQATCVGEGRVFRCVFEDVTWACAAVDGSSRGPAEAASR